MATDLGFSNIFPDAFWLHNNAAMPSYEQDRRIHFRREFELTAVPEKAIRIMTLSATTEPVITQTAARFRFPSNRSFAMMPSR